MQQTSVALMAFDRRAVRSKCGAWRLLFQRGKRPDRQNRMIAYHRQDAALQQAHVAAMLCVP